MKTEWKNCVGHYRASIPVDYKRWDFTYVNPGNMSCYSPEPFGKAYNNWNDNVFSTDVIVCGSEKEKHYLLAGALTAFRSQSFFTAKYRNRKLIEIEVEQPYIKPGETPEEIIVLEGDDWRELLFRYAEMSAEKMGVKNIDSAENMTGYCTWYYYYKDVTQAHLLENVEALSANRSVFSAQYVQIDDGFQTLQGDWLDRHENWPVPLDVTARKITDNGMKAGIWLMPFTASTASRVYNEHPDWFVKDANGETVTLLGWTPAPDHLWACLDTTQKAVQEHLKHIFQTFRSWGYTYFKMDGLNFGLYEGVRQDPDATPISAYRLGLQVIREAVPDCLIMACSEPFMPSVGLVDNARVSNDTSRDFMVGRTTRNVQTLGVCISSAVRITLGNFWKFDRWFRCDPDTIMARQDNAFYTRGEAKISVLSGIMTGISITSDHLGTIAPDRLALLGKAQNLRMRSARPVITEWKNEWPSIYEGTVDGKRAVALINETDSAVKYRFADLGMPEKCTDLLEERVYTSEIEIPSHDAALLV